MEKIRQIINEELQKLLEVDIIRSTAGTHPIFSDPEKAYDFALEWIEKANRLTHFHQLVGNVAFNASMPTEEVIEEIKRLYKEFVEV